MSAPTLSPSHASLQLVESARYALLRRLAFAMRHEMVVHFQPIGMVTEVIDRRLRAPQPDLAQVQEAVGKIQGYSKQAAQSCLEMITWLAPEATATVSLDALVDETMRLLRSNFSFRGFNLRTELPALPQRVQKSGLRMLLPACLLTLSDDAVSPADIVLRAEIGDGEATLDMRVLPTEGDPSLPSDPPYRPLAWPEVQALARDEGMSMEQGEGWVRLTLALHEGG